MFRFLRENAPDITGVIEGTYAPEFLVAEIKSSPLKLEHVYQARRYAELLDARYGVLISTFEIPEEIKRLAKVVYPLLSLPAYKRLTLAYFDAVTGRVVDWFPEDPFAALNP